MFVYWNHNSTSCSLSIFLFVSQGIDFDGQKARVFSGIRSGAYNLNVFISSDGLLTDIDLIDSGKLRVEDLFDSQKYLSFHLDHLRDINVDGGVICKIDQCKYNVLNRNLKKNNCLKGYLHFDHYLALLFSFFVITFLMSWTLKDIKNRHFLLQCFRLLLLVF